MSLAQLFYDGLQVGEGAVAAVAERWAQAKGALDHGFRVNHSAPAHKVLADFIAKDAVLAAQRFTIDGQNYNNLQRLGVQVFDTGIRPRLPASPMWLEAPLSLDFSSGEMKGHVGCLLREDQGWWCCDYFTDIFTPDVVAPWVSGKIWHHGFRDLTLRREWYAFEECALNCAVKGDELFDALSNATSLIVAALNTPRVVQREAVTWQPAIQKARLKRGKHPLLSFNRVKIELPKTSAHHASTMRREQGGGVRFHGVLGHLRRIEKPYGPELTWVSPHFRGDARLGVVVKERQVKVAR